MYNVSNALIAFQILLSLALSMASAERSFFELKFIKTVVCFPMLQDRLDVLAAIFIELDCASALDRAELVAKIALKKAGKRDFDEAVLMYQHSVNID